MRSNQNNRLFAGSSRRLMRNLAGILALALIALTGFTAVSAQGKNPAAAAGKPGQFDVQQTGGEGQELPGGEDETTPLGEPAPVGLNDVVVARTDIPIGTRLTADLLATELRPTDNIALRAGVAVSAIDDIVGQIVKTDIAEGQEILVPMIALSPTDLVAIGSDLALHMSNGRVTIALPVNQFSGIAYAMRPGDFVDVLMTFNLVELDLEFQTPLPNITQLVEPSALEEGMPFLLPAVSQGRLEFIEEIGQVAEITPGQIVPEDAASAEETIVRQKPRRVTQLTVQQAEVLWVGNWRHPGSPDWQGPNNFGLAEFTPDTPLTPEEQTRYAQEFGIVADNVGNLSSLARGRTTFIAPEFVLVSLPLQDALILKWAFEEPGIKIDLALRAQGDNALYVTTSVSLPQLVDQAGLSIPEPSQFGLEPYVKNLIQYRLLKFPFNDLIEIGTVTPGP